MARLLGPLPKGPWIETTLRYYGDGRWAGGKGGGTAGGGPVSEVEDVGVPEMTL